MLTHRTSWFWRHGPQRDGECRLFCVPCAGHGASMYYTWPNHLPRQVEVWALQPPGREDRLHETAFDDVHALVREAASALEPMLDDRPFALAGHSMGALIGFELTRELRRRGLPLPRRLFVSGHAAPQSGVTGEIRHNLSDAAFVRSIQQMNGELTGDQEYLDAIRMMLPTLRADFTLCERYPYVEELPLPCDLCVWGGESDPETNVTQLAEWREQTTGKFSLRMFAGDHFFVKTARKAVLRVLAAELEPLVRPAPLAMCAGGR
jgi:medium-chain acyl-[acyl-carrier-protein] hydrolase